MSQRPRISYGSGRTSSHPIDDSDAELAFAQLEAYSACSASSSRSCEPMISDGRHERAETEQAEDHASCCSPAPNRALIPRRGPSAAPATAKNPSVTTGISQSQSTPACSAHTDADREQCAVERAPRPARAHAKPNQNRAHEDQEQREPGNPELGHRLQVQAVGVDRVDEVGRLRSHRVWYIPAP